MTGTEEALVTLGDIGGTGDLPDTLYPLEPKAAEAAREAASTFTALDSAATGRPSGGSTPAGVEGEEEKRGKYEGKVILRNLVGSGISVTAFLGAIILASGKILRDSAAQSFRIDKQSQDLVWWFGKDGNGGASVVDILTRSTVPGVDFDRRETWDYRGDVRVKILGQGGNAVGEKAQVIVKFTDALLSHGGRVMLIQHAQQTGCDYKQIDNFDTRMNIEEIRLSRHLTWEEAAKIMQEFGFSQKIVNVFTELRKEYYTGNGNLNKAIQEAQKVSQGTMGPAAEKAVAQKTAHVTRAETRQRTGVRGEVAYRRDSRENWGVQQARLAETQGLIEATGVDRVVDAKILMEMADALRTQTNLKEGVQDVTHMVPDLPYLSPLTEGGPNPLLMFVVTLGYVATRTRLCRESRRILENLAEKMPRLRTFLASNKQKGHR